MSQFDPEQLASWCGGEWAPGPPQAVTRITHDSRTITPGALFVAIRGVHHDGHAFVAAACAAGAAGALVDYAAEVAVDPAFPLLRAPDTKDALNALAWGHRRTLSGTVVGVTGSVGKTTVKEMLATILDAQGSVARTRGNWNNDIGMPLSVLTMTPEDYAGVFEIGMNHPGEIAGLCATLRPDCGIITPIGPVHTAFFVGVDAIAAEKSALLLALPGDGLAVIDGDSPYADFLRAASAAPLVTVARHVPCDIRWSYEADGRTTLHDEQTGAEASVRLPAPGHHNALDAALAAALACRRFGMPLATIAEQLSRFVPPAMRWEELDVHGIRVINDAYNANPLSMRAAIDAFAALDTAGARWLVLGDMLELGACESDEHKELGRYLAVQSDWAGLLAVGGLGAAIVAGARENGCPADRALAFKTCCEAGAALRERARAGDVVLLKASRGVALEQVISELEP